MAALVTAKEREFEERDAGRFGTRKYGGSAGSTSRPCVIIAFKKGHIEMNTLMPGTFENVTVGLLHQPTKVFLHAQNEISWHYKNLQKPGHIYSVDYLEALQQVIKNKESSGFRSGLKKILYSFIRKPTAAD